jgi:uncharacterized membrane protein YwzB
MGVGRGNRSTRRKPAQVPLFPPQITHDLTWARTRAAAVGSRRLTAWALARPLYEYIQYLTMSVNYSPLFSSPLNWVSSFYYIDNSVKRTYLFQCLLCLISRSGIWMCAWHGTVLKSIWFAHIINIIPNRYIATLFRSPAACVDKLNHGWFQFSLVSCLWAFGGNALYADVEITVRLLKYWNHRHVLLFLFYYFSRLTLRQAVYTTVFVKKQNRHNCMNICFILVKINVDTIVSILFLTNIVV